MQPDRKMLEVQTVIGQRMAPAGILEQLREIDARADLIYAAPGVWMLGVWNQNAEATRRAQGSIERMLKAPVGIRNNEAAGRIAFYHLCARGFRPIDLYDMSEPDTSIVADFRQADWRYRHGRDREFETLADMADVGNARAQATVREKFQAEARDIQRIIFRRVRNFTRRATGLGSSVRKLIRRIG